MNNGDTPCRADGAFAPLVSGKPAKLTARAGPDGRRWDASSASSEMCSAVAADRHDKASVGGSQFTVTKGEAWPCRDLVWWEPCEGCIGRLVRWAGLGRPAILRRQRDGFRLRHRLRLAREFGLAQ